MSATTALPELNSEYPLSQEQIASFRANGHALLRNVCSPEEISVYRDALVSAAERYNTERRPLNERDTYGKAFLQIMNLWENDEPSKTFTFAKRFAKIAADLLGVDAVRLYHDQALFKEPGGGHTPWHQDQYYWPLGTDKTVTMWMPLVDATEDMGTMTFASRSHKDGFLANLEISDESEAKFQEFVQNKGFELTRSGAMKAGDATFHTGWTLHSAPGNATGTTREAMTIIYFADGATLLEPDNKNRQNDLERWLPGQKAGELAGSRLNPIIYSRG